MAREGVEPPPFPPLAETRFRLRHRAEWCALLVCSNKAHPPNNWVTQQNDMQNIEHSFYTVK